MVLGFVSFESSAEVVDQEHEEEHEWECEDGFRYEIFNHTLYIFITTPNKDPEVMVGIVNKMRSKLTADLPVLGSFFCEFFQMEAMEPPMRKI